MKNIKFYIKLALEYRLSLENLCKLMRIEPTEENQTTLYYEILKNIQYGTENIYVYLFNYETRNESQDISNEAYKQAVNLIRNYLYYKNVDVEKSKKVLNKLNHTDEEYMKIKPKYIGYSNSIDEEDVETICKYRLKYAISRAEIADRLGVSVEMLRRREAKLDDEVLKEKLKLLNEYSEALKLKSSKGEIKRRC